ncbi:MAG: sensor histidine kinase [Kofleriaceae bacterium]
MAIVAFVWSALVLMTPDLFKLARGEMVPGLDLLLVPPWVAFEVIVLLMVLRAGEYRRWSTITTLVLAYAATAALSAVSVTTYAIASHEIAPLADSPRACPDGLACWGTAAVIRVVIEGATAGLLIVGIWTLFYVLPAALDAARERSELRRELERAKVRATLEPHFVLNTLNAIGSLVGSDPARARELIGDLGELLRDTVRLAERDLHPTREEVAWLVRYTRILEARHQGRLEVEWNVDPVADMYMIPTLVLQPLIENAIHHGALGRAEGGTVKIAITVNAGSLRCTIRDDGPGIPADAPRVGARGLDLTRRRLACDAPGASLELVSDTCGTEAVVVVPGVVA